ncbi:LiPocalin protein variant 1b, partial [Trichostrongylus colubriformis]
GPEPGEMLYMTGHRSDNCPYFPVKMGGLNRQGEYEYIVFSQPLKYPSMVLARDLNKFEQKYQQEVYKFLEKYGYLSPITALNTRLHFENATACAQISQPYDQMTP